MKATREILKSEDRIKRQSEVNSKILVKYVENAIKKEKVCQRL